MGVARYGERTIHRCWFVNTSSRSASLARIKTSCDCVSANYSPVELAPGSKTLVEFVHVAGLKPNSSPTDCVLVDAYDDDGGHLLHTEISVETIATDAQLPLIAARFQGSEGALDPAPAREKLE
jgi:hypothetical protein